MHTGWLNAAELRRWREAYEAAGVAADEVPPPSLLALAKNAGVIAASTAARAIASAQLLAPGREAAISPLLSELELPPPNLGRLRLPLSLWMPAIGFSVAVRPETETHRARDAANWLSQLATEHELVVAVTHGSVRRLISRELLHLGWKLEARQGIVHHWSAWSLSR